MLIVVMTLRCRTHDRTVGGPKWPLHIGHCVAVASLKSRQLRRVRGRLSIDGEPRLSTTDRSADRCAVDHISSTRFTQPGTELRMHTQE